MSGSYSAEISRAHPMGVLFLVDQSNSMGEPYGADIKLKKSEGVADVINRCLQNIIVRATRDDGVRDYMQVAIVGYTTDPTGKTALIRNMLPAAARDADDRLLSFAPISRLADNLLRMESKMKKVYDGAGGFLEVPENSPVWLEPFPLNTTDAGGTPISAALRAAAQLIGDWASQNPGSFPPLVLHITDGESTDGDPIPAAEELQKVATLDGNALLFNCHLSALEGQTAFFPNSDTSLPTDPFAPTLYLISSVLPESMRLQASGTMALPEKARCFVFNADLIRLIEFVNMGTLTAATIR